MCLSQLSCFQWLVIIGSDASFSKAARACTRTAQQSSANPDLRSSVNTVLQAPMILWRHHAWLHRHCVRTTVAVSYAPYAISPAPRQFPRCRAQLPDHDVDRLLRHVQGLRGHRYRDKRPGEEQLDEGGEPGIAPAALKMPLHRQGCQPQRVEVLPGPIGGCQGPFQKPYHACFIAM